MSAGFNIKPGDKVTFGFEIYGQPSGTVFTLGESTLSHGIRATSIVPPIGSIHTHTDYANPDKPEELQQFIHVGNGKLERIETVNKRLKL